MPYSTYAHVCVQVRTHTRTHKRARTHTRTQTEFVTEESDHMKTTGGLEERHKTQREVDEAERCTRMRLAADKADLHRHRAACLSHSHSYSLSLSSVSVVSRVHAASVCCLPSCAVVQYACVLRVAPAWPCTWCMRGVLCVALSLEQMRV